MNRRTIVLLTLLILLSTILGGCMYAQPVNVVKTPLHTEEATPTAEPTPTATPEPTSTPEPTPEPTATPEPTPEMLDGAPLDKYYDTEWPENAVFDLKYDKYKIYPSYFVALKSANIRKLPTTKSPVISGLGFGQRIKLTASVEVDGRKWYRVEWTRKGETHHGYMHQITGSPREFQIDKMLERAQKIKDVLDNGKSVYVNNYKNLSGRAPRLPSRKTTDEFGYRRSQSAPGYEKPDKESNFRYIPDGMAGIIEEENEDFKKVYIPSFDTSVWIPIKYLSKDDKVKKITQVVVVDRENQNSGILEWTEDGWKIVALSFVSTGKTGEYSLPTPLGDYMAIQRRFKFLYYHDGTKDIAGYAPYTIRFSGGGYLHGVPRTYGKDEFGNLIDPGHAEALKSLGTTPRSHMCVRNYTSHAKYLYNWVDIGSCAVIVIE